MSELVSPKIAIPGDELVLDEALADEWDCTRRTLARYEIDGLPYVLVAGRKYRPLAASRQWLANRIRKPNPRRAA
jgi:hypothetical protein